MKTDSKIFVAGGRGLVGSAIKRVLVEHGYKNILTPTSCELDLRDEKSVFQFFESQEPEFVFLAAAKVGGIYANNTYPVDFLMDNLRIQNNVIEAAYKFKSKKLLFLGSSCIYPKLAPQPINEVELLNGYLEETNKAYSIAKIAGITLCQSFNKQYNTNFISVMPTNLYGLNDNYHPTDSHVIPGLIRRLHEAKLEKRAWVEIWGSGKPMREFLFADDLADACLFLMKTYNSSEIINVGSGEELSILELAHHIKKAVGFQGEIKLNKNMLDGTPRKIIDSSRIHNLGWKHKTDFFEGLKITYQDFKNKLDA